MKLTEIAPTITEQFVRAMIRQQSLKDQEADGLVVSPFSHEQADTYAKSLHECFMALYPNFIPDPLAAYSAVIRKYAAQTGDKDLSDAAEALWLTAKEDIGEVGKEIPVETPNDSTTLPMIRTQDSRKDRRSISLSHRTARGAKDKAQETQENVHEGRRTLRSKVVDRAEQWAHKLDD